MCAVTLQLYFMLIAGYATVNGVDLQSSRGKRALLVYPPPRSIIQMVMGVGLPLDLRNEAVIVGMVLKSGYELPTNSSVYTSPNIEYVRKKRSLTRWNIYSLMAEASELHGFGGKACILRTICEVATIQIDKKGGLLGEIIHTIFTPSTTKDMPETHLDNMYIAAEYLGQEMKDRCEDLFAECPISFVDLFTRL